MIARIIKFSSVLLLLVLLVSPSFSQRQTGSITGIVEDDNSTPLPGVSVTLSGASIMGTQVYTTTQEGNFRFPAVPQGMTM